VGLFLRLPLGEMGSQPCKFVDTIPVATLASADGEN